MIFLQIVSLLHLVQMDKHYKEIYQDCKRRLETFKDIDSLEID